MTTTNMIDSTAGEVTHLFEVMKKYEATCGLEFNWFGVRDPFIGISGVPVDVEYFEGTEGDSVIVKMGEAEVSFSLGDNSFGKHVSDCQITICIMENDGKYCAWFDSSAIPSEGIEEANNYKEHDDFEDKQVELNVMSEDFQDDIRLLGNLLHEGRVIKNVEVKGAGEQVLTVGYIEG